MGLAVLGDAIGQRAQAPIFAACNLALAFDKNLGEAFRQRLNLRSGQVLTRQEDMLVKRHFSLLVPIVDGAQCPRPSGWRLSSRRAGPARRSAAYGGRGQRLQVILACGKRVSCPFFPCLACCWPQPSLHRNPMRPSPWKPAGSRPNRRALPARPMHAPGCHPIPITANMPVGRGRSVPACAASPIRRWRRWCWRGSRPQSPKPG